MESYLFDIAFTYHLYPKSETYIIFINQNKLYTILTCTCLLYYILSIELFLNIFFQYYFHTHMYIIDVFLGRKKMALHNVKGEDLNISEKNREQGTFPFKTRVNTNLIYR